MRSSTASNARCWNPTWNFVAYSQGIGDKRKKVEGLVQASTDIYAIAKIKKMGFLTPLVKLDIWNSITSGFGYLSPTDFDLRDKSRLYDTLSRRLAREGSIITALESSLEYLQDGRLKSAVAIMASSLSDGQSVHEAMLRAGFTYRDAMVVRSLHDSGRLDKAFADLGKEARTRHQRESAVRSAVRTPIIVVSCIYLLLIPVFFLGIGPSMASFFKKLGSVSIPDSIKLVYAAVAWVNLNLPAAIVLWLLLGAGGIALIKSNIWLKLSMQIPAFSNLTTKSEHASLWSVYGLMYAAGIAPQDICNVLREAVRIPETAQCLRQMSRRMAAGGDDRDAVQSAGFPRFVVAGYRAARDSGSLSEGLVTFTDMLNEDIVQLTAQVQGWLQAFSLLLMGSLVMAVFYLFYYPIAGPVLQSL